MEKTEVCIIGGGVIGLTCAYYLNKEGYGVTVLDKGPRESASSHGNCGLISSSHIIPLNNFNLIFKSVKWLFKKNAPFYIKPRFDPVLWEWLIKFVLNALLCFVLKGFCK